MSTLSRQSGSLRLLDLGAHDGFVGHWLLRDMPDLHIDAVELNSMAAKLCSGRVSGECKIGLAEDAPELFEPGSYDAVSAMELIEHVPDIDRFLGACEQMVKPGGRVYISTPDGTFGEGRNPHHLRALRAIDLVDILRRRGRLADMTVGSDGVSVASYIPGPRREDIAIYCGAGWEPWAPGDIAAKGLGGSETAAVRLAGALSDMGFVVTVYGEMTEDTCVKDVIYRHHSKFDPLEPRGCVIASRLPEIFDRPVAARTRMLWVHDVDCADRLTQARYERIDHILCLSRWHESHLAGAYPFAADRLVRISNAIHHPYFQPQPWADRAKRVLYTSSPDRGLDVLLEHIWPRVRERVPDAELHHCYATVYDKIAERDPAIGAFRDRVRALADQPGVRSIGSLSQPDLARLMCDSRVWCHPSWMGQHSAAFCETSCIGATEAQAAGCVVVASDWGALSETVRYGYKVNSGGMSARWTEGFVNAIVDGLTDPEVGAQAVARGPEAIADVTWENVAAKVGALVGAGDRPGVRA